ncbi:NfeD family protein [Parvibaculum sedimenti]|uniref:NfeD family protein n=1 Tax=Parvibaculum sedimenti TaxID=2608632 RepID=A0A6N6VLL2_9HYPH|nr:NfeD family protein [Parvibaculum sedimenti]KAB7741143.1 NfeD family protein [Parvibaculum sedimenti]
MLDSLSLDEFGLWAWWIIAAVLGILELIVPGIFFIWLAAAAAVVALVAMAVDIPLTLQVALFAVLSVIAVWTSRRYFARHEVPSDHPLLNQRARTYVGRNYTLELAIRNGRGKIRIGDTLWLVEGPDLPAGATVHVTGVDDDVLKVEAVH